MENRVHGRCDSSPKPTPSQHHQRTGSHAREQSGKHGSNHEKCEHRQATNASGDRSSSPLKQENASRDKIVLTIRRCLDVAVEFSPELFEALLATLENRKKEVERQKKEAEGQLKEAEGQLKDCNGKIQRCRDLKRDAEEDNVNVQKSREMLERRIERNENGQQFIRMVREIIRIVESAEKRYRDLNDYMGLDLGGARGGFDELFKKAKEDIHSISDASEPAINTKK